MGSFDRPREADTEDVTDPSGVVRLNRLAANLRGQGLATEFESGRLRVTSGPECRGVELECRRRAGDFDRWWFTWAGGIWLCEADQPMDAVVQVKSALRRVSS